jgi:hypothetical protein
MTSEAARQQFVKLANAGLVEAYSQTRGVGRPVQLWQLTSKGHGRFSDTHADLTVQLLDAVRETFGPAVIEASTVQLNIRKQKSPPMKRGFRLHAPTGGLIDLVVTTGASAKDQNDFRAVDTVNDTYIAGPDTPVTSQAATQGFADFIRLTRRDSLAYDLEYSLCLGAAKQLEVVFYRRMKPDAPHHGLLPN